MSLQSERQSSQSSQALAGGHVASSAGPALEEVAAERVLAELHASGALASGRAHILSFRAIHDAMAGRWPERKARVWEMAEAQIQRRIGKGDLMARLNDDAFLVVTPELDPASAQVLAVRIMRDITTHFLGELKIQDISILVAQSFNSQQLACRPLTDAELDRAVAAEKSEPERDHLPISGTSVGAPTSDVAGELTTLEGRRLRFSVNVAPTIDLTKFAIAGHRIEPKITFEDTDVLLSSTARKALLPPDIQEVDLAVLRRGIARLNSGQSRSDRPSLILTVSFLTLSNTRSRTRLLAEAAKIRAAAVKAVIFEVADFDEGVPLGRLKEAGALLRPFCRSIFIRADPSGALARSFKGLGFSGLVVESPLIRVSEEDQALWLLSVSHSVETCAGTAIAANLPSKSLLPIAVAAGFTHATVTG